jgi:hypothetical protein
MTNLSDAAQEVFWAYNREASGKPDDHHMLEAIAAALRAAADQVVPVESHPEESQFWDDESEREWQNNRHVRLQFLAIAAELKEFAIQ